jgi:DNA primase
MLFPETFISEIREANDITEVISNYVSLKKSGSNYKGLCPFHSEKTPSFMVSPSKQIFHCFGCGEGGDVFRFLMQYENRAFPDAVRALAQRCGKPLPTVERSPQEAAQQQERERIFEMNRTATELFVKARTGSEKATDYLRRRGVSDAVLTAFSIGYAPDSWDTLYSHLRKGGFRETEMERAGLVLQRKQGSGGYDRFRNRIMFPIADTYDRVLGFGGRVLDDSLPKYLNSPETPVFDKGSTLYGLNMAGQSIRKLDYAVLVEGYMDVVTAHQHGIRNIVATLGTSLTQGHIRRLRRYTRNLALFFDADAAGLKAAARCFDLCVPAGMKIKVVTLPPGEDPDSFIRASGKEGFAGRMAQAEPIMDFMIEQIRREELSRGLEGKVAAAERLSLLLAAIPNPVEQELYLQKVAAMLEIDAQTLKKSLRTVKRRAPSTAETRPARTEAPKQRVPRLEGKFVGHLVNHPDLIPEVRETVSPALFGHRGLRSFVQRIFELPAQEAPGGTALSGILAEDAGLAAEIRRYVMEEREPFDLKGSVRRLELEHLKRQRKKLQSEVSLAEKEGRHPEVTRLMDQINQLNRQIECLK